MISFQSNQSHKSFVDQLKANFSDALKKPLKITMLIEEHFQNKIGFSELNRGIPIFEVDVVICQIDGQLKYNSRIELGHQFLYEIDRNTNQIRKRCSLVDLDTIRFIDESKQVNLILQFEKSFQS